MIIERLCWASSLLLLQTEVVRLQHSVTTVQRWGATVPPATAGSNVTLISGVTDCWRRGDLLTFYFWPPLPLRPSDAAPGGHYRGTVASNPQPLVTHSSPRVGQGARIQTLLVPQTHWLQPKWSSVWRPSGHQKEQGFAFKSSVDPWRPALGVLILLFILCIYTVEALKVIQGLSLVCFFSFRWQMRGEHVVMSVQNWDLRVWHVALHSNWVGCSWGIHALHQQVHQSHFRIVNAWRWWREIRVIWKMYVLNFVLKWQEGLSSTFCVSVAPWRLNVQSSSHSSNLRDVLSVLSEVNAGWPATSLSRPKVCYLSGWQLISNSTCMDQPSQWLRFIWGGLTLI